MIIPNLSIIFPNFLHITLVYHILQLQVSFNACAHIPSTLWVFTFYVCTHGNKRIGTHDAICDTFDAIVRDASFRVGQEQLHALPSTTFNSSHQRVDIVLTKDGICTLVNIVITNLTQANLLPQSCATQGFVAFNMI
jgi:hypothetical protein